MLQRPTRRTLLTALIAVGVAGAGPAGAADAFVLIDATDAERERAHQRTLSAEELEQPPLVTRSIFPSIRIVAPSSAAAGTLKAPLRLELVFHTSPGARIVPESFRVFYGLLKLDVTERLRKNAQVSERGVVAENAMLPAGAHRLYLQVADSQGRFFERELRFKVDG